MYIRVPGKGCCWFILTSHLQERDRCGLKGMPWDMGHAPPPGAPRLPEFPGLEHEAEGAPLPPLFQVGVFLDTMRQDPSWTQAQVTHGPVQSAHRLECGAASGGWSWGVHILHLGQPRDPLPSHVSHGTQAAYIPLLWEKQRPF